MMSKYWMPIETAPKDGTEILVMYHHCGQQFVHVASWSWINEAERDYETDGDVWNTYQFSTVANIDLDGFREPKYWLPLPNVEGLIENWNNELEFQLRPSVECCYERDPQTKHLTLWIALDDIEDVQDCEDLSAIAILTKRDQEVFYIHDTTKHLFQRKLDRYKGIWYD